MFFSCPHCRELVAIDRETRLPPLMCPRCGGVIREEVTDIVDPGPTPAGISIASLLQGSGLAAAADEETATVEEAPPASANPMDVSFEASRDEESVADGLAEEASIITDDGNETDAAAVEQIARQDGAAKSPEPATAVSSAPQYLGPSFTLQRRQATTHARNAKWQWVALVVLATTLGLQVLLADRERLAADASWRPTIAFLCNVTGCSLPAWHQPGAFAMLSRDVSPIPGTGGLNVQATFRNDARWPQPWPVLLLSLSDADGRVLGARAFSPREYLGAGATQTELAPGQSAQIALKLHEPNPDVVAFSFDFR